MAIPGKRETMEDRCYKHTFILLASFINNNEIVDNYN